MRRGEAASADEVARACRRVATQAAEVRRLYAEIEAYAYSGGGAAEGAMPTAAWTADPVAQAATDPGRARARRALSFATLCMNLAERVVFRASRVLELAEGDEAWGAIRAREERRAAGRRHSGVWRSKP